MLGIIGGTGLCHPGEGAWEPVEVSTPFGLAQVLAGEWEARRIAFLPRHGLQGRVPPHLVNYRANVTALQMLGCRQVLAVNAVGSLDPQLRPGDLCLAEQFLDFTCARPRTLYEPPEHETPHVDMTEPYCPRLRTALSEVCANLGLVLGPPAVYACMEGPRFETPAEIRMLRLLGAGVVGMTGVPEVVFAREAGLCYAALCVVTNLAAGLSPTPLTAREVTDLMDARRLDLLRLLREAAGRVCAEPSACACGVAL